MIPGWPYSVVAALEPGRTSWTAVLDAVPGVQAVLPPTAIGKDYPYDGRWLRVTPSGTGPSASSSATVGW